MSRLSPPNYPRLCLDGPREHQEEVQVAQEEPLEIRLGGIPIAVVMRTPGHDEDLTLGFLWGEGIITAPSQVISIRHCSSPTSEEAEDNVILVHPREDLAISLEKIRRNTYASSSCGVCGKGSIENVCRTGPRVESQTQVSREVLAGLPLTLRQHQSLFAATGGVHGIGLFSSDGELELCREDVGRHNAVDKVVGWGLRTGRLPSPDTILLVSGRVSFEIIQKAMMAQIPIVAAISAPTSLAVQLAEESGITLVAFLRGHKMGVYTHPWRIKGEEVGRPPRHPEVIP